VVECLSSIVSSRVQTQVLPKKKMELGMVVHACNSSTQEAEARGKQVRGQPGLDSKMVSQKYYYY
jgi:hypothetical protein